MNLTEKIEKLNSSLIYKMSLGSKELYHSNVWAWLIENDSSFANAFCDNVPEGYSFHSVEREKHNRDLTVWYVNKEGNYKCFVIENKLKSIPTREQLEKYSDELGTNCFAGFLTGLKEPNILDENGQVVCGDCVWEFVSYSKLSARMENKLKSSENAIIKANHSQILEYLENNTIVEEIVDSSIVDGKLVQTTDSDLNRLGLRDLTNKVVGSYFVRYFYNRLKEEGRSIPLLYVGESFHNKKITLDFKLSNWKEYEEKKCPYLYIGVQIEGDQYRRMITVSDGYCSLDELYDEYVKLKYLDGTFVKKSGLIHFPGDPKTERLTKLSKQYCQYDGRTVYQYSILNDSDLSFDDLYRRIVNDLSLCESYMKKNRQKPFHKK